MSFNLILFGGTGDLAWRKIMPALFQAFRHGSLPADGRIVGVARDDLSDDQYRALIKSRFDNVELAKRPSEEEFTRFAQMLGYLRMDLSNPADYARLAGRLEQRPADVVVMYLATAPGLFTTVCEQIAAAGLNGPKADGIDLRLNLVFSDIRESYVLWIENAVLHHRKGPPDKNANATLTLTQPVFIKMMTGTAGVKDTLLSDDLRVSGSRIDLLRFFSLIDKAPRTFAIVTP